MNDNTADGQKTLQELKLVRKRVEELEARQEELLAEQAALREQVEKYRAAFEYSGDSIFLLDASETRILDANSIAARRLGYSQEELLAGNYQEIEIPPEQSESWESVVSSTLVYESTLRHKNGSLIPVEVSSRPVAIGGEYGVQKAMRDITRRKAAEEEREQLIKDLDAFSHTVAHNLKGSLFKIGGFAEQLVSLTTDEQQQEYLGWIVHGATKMQEVIEGLLLLAHVQKQEDRPIERLDMERIIAHAFHREAYQIEEFEPEISVPDEWPATLGHAPWVEEVWTNYLSNAIKYGGQPPRVRLGAEKHNGYVRFWVSDNGPGVTPEEQDQLFAPFVRLAREKPARGMGYGLGLSIVRRIVEKLDGEVGVESTPGEGSTFWFTLPTDD
jgi:PAS domain S-box-containing protein